MVRSSWTTSAGVTPTAGRGRAKSVARFQKRRRSSFIERLEARGELLVDLLALHLQRRREQAVRDRQRRLDDDELLERLVAGELGVDGVDPLLHERARRFRPRVRRDASLIEVRADGLLVEPDARDQIPPRVAVDDDVREERVVAEALLDVRGRDVLAAGRDEDVLLAVDD